MNPLKNTLPLLGQLVQNHHCNLSQISDCVPPSRNGLSHANRTRNADGRP